MNKDTWSYYSSIGTIAKDTSLSKRTIMRQIAVLEKKN
ncbi:helix-turn-helix domain-containing protein [Candidatus Stoquefichus sp. SB1]|nr:helix-turn-helix domain-containing protein [Candidatus Stoquefichus sp. SB1]